MTWLVLVVVLALAWERRNGQHHGWGTLVTIIAFLLTGYGVVSIGLWLAVPTALALIGLGRRPAFQSRGGR